MVLHLGVIRMDLANSWAVDSTQVLSINQVP